VASPYGKEPGVCALLGFEEVQCCCCAGESCDRNDQSEGEESEEREVKLRRRLAEHLDRIRSAFVLVSV
jgi:hypothetical protein